MTLLSIIIPCFNSEKFIIKTIEMLLRQDFSECELILVNDGSTDDTLFILREYESLKNNIFVIDQPNRGVSAARNIGLFQAKGKYVYFLDSDDTLAEGSLAHFKQIITQHPDCQMFAFGYETRRGGCKVKSYVYPFFDIQEMSGKILMKNYLNKKLCLHICSCIYNRHFLQKYKFHFREEVKMGEDLLFCLSVMLKVDKMYYSARLSYIYQLHENSITKGRRLYSKEVYGILIYLQDFFNKVAKNDKSMQKSINFFLSLYYLSHLRRYLRSDLKSKEINVLFISDGKIRYRRNYSGNIAYWFLLKLSMLIPVKLILKIWK